MDRDAREVLEKRIASGYSLPTLSPVAVKLVEIASEDTCSLVDLISLIEKDPSLAVSLLKMANSAFFMAGQPVATLRAAIMRIGFQQVRVMGLSLSLRNTFPMGKVGSLDYENFWRISLYRGLIGKSLAQHLRACNPEEAFVAGLILEIGFLIFYDLYLKHKPDVIIPDLDGLEELLRWEEEQCGINHRTVGEFALAYWKFPEQIVACQKYYGDEIADNNVAPLARVSELARVFSHAMFHKQTDFHALFLAVRNSLGLPDETINDIILAAFEQVEDIAESLKLELNKERDLLELMEKANRSLGRLSEKITRYRDEMSKSGLPAFDTLERKEHQPSVEYTLQAVAHEIRNPLVTVAGFARRLSKALDPASESARYAAIILEEAKRLETILSDMDR
ncbi:MAG TPA: HDOD domain-containing protein [Syntrophorhabdaceae bacterium]|nr:HDOD domain-containing protein [Syntrophorhabdaceae bacterium]